MQEYAARVLFDVQFLGFWNVWGARGLPVQGD